MGWLFFPLFFKFNLEFGVLAISEEGKAKRPKEKLSL